MRKMPSRVKIFITGASSEMMQRFISTVNVDLYEIIGLSRRTDNPDLRIKWVVGDIRDTELIARQLNGCRVLIHAAAVTHTRKLRVYNEINFEATDRLVDAANSAGVDKIVYISSRAAGFESGGYGLSKKMAEERIIRKAKSFLILRLSEIYGLHDGNDFVTKTIKYTINNRLIFCPSGMSSRLSPLHLDDSVAIMYDLIFNKPYNNKIVTINGQEDFTLEELIHRVADICHKNIHLVQIPVKAMFVLQKLLELIPFPVGIVPDQVSRLYSVKESQCLGYALNSVDNYIHELKQAIGR